VGNQRASVGRATHAIERERPHHEHQYRRPDREEKARGAALA
jgi:hypothetical protein